MPTENLVEEPTSDIADVQASPDFRQADDSESGDQGHSASCSRQGS